MELSEAKGRLMAIGGGDLTKDGAPLLKEFVKLARGPRARVVVMTPATDDPEAAAKEYEQAFKQLGVDDVRTVDVSARSDAARPEALEAIERATGLFFTGGDQLHITSLIGGSEMQKLIFKRYEKGLVVGGTSAGAAMMSNSMILGGGGEESPKVGGVRIGPGMDLLVGAVIDTHFFQRGRFGRLLAATSHYPQDLGLGLDEETAMVIRGTEFEVFGRGGVTVIDAGSMSYTSLPYVEEGEAISVFGVQVHVLSAGHKFDLANRRPVIEEGEAVKRGQVSESEGPKESKKPRAGKKSKGK
ncbi:MAG TPA: cyanophycinase [Pyrinomonadaceae bacterium]|jgi:cyanophycinase|nr:cyanophycinase [Pyrinomonadaceae bacterium]